MPNKASAAVAAVTVFMQPRPSAYTLPVNHGSTAPVPTVTATDRRWLNSNHHQSDTGEGDVTVRYSPSTSTTTRTSNTRFCGIIPIRIP